MTRYEKIATAGDRLLDRQYGQEDEAIRDQRQRTAPKASVTKLRRHVTDLLQLIRQWMFPGNLD